MNPVVVKRLLRSWMADEVLPYNRAFYPEVEKMTGASFYAPVEVYRMFPNGLVVGEWNRRMAEGDMDDFLSPDIYDYAPGAVTGPGFGGADIYQAARVDCGIFIGALRRHFAERGLLRHKTLDYTDLSVTETGFEAGGEPFSDIVFCEGMQAKANPWFSALPLLPTKGELLFLDIPGFPRQKEVMKGIFLAPLIHGGFVCGSTYDWQFTDEGPTAAGRGKLLEGLAQLTALPYRIERHTAGVRPASRDRRPLVGEHPRHKGMFVLNGLGTKGYMLAPYLSGALAAHILHGTPLPAEADIRRTSNKTAW